jgi:hypothetical protein
MAMKTHFSARSGVGALPLGMRHVTHFTEGRVDHIAGPYECGKSRPPPGFEYRTVQHVTSRFTDYSISVHRKVINKQERELKKETLLVVIRARSQGSGCTAAIRLIVHPVF